MLLPFIENEGEPSEAVWWCDLHCFDLLVEGADEVNGFYDGYAAAGIVATAIAVFAFVELFLSGTSLQ
jgi:hypothetical protein